MTDTNILVFGEQIYELREGLGEISGRVACSALHSLMICLIIWNRIFNSLIGIKICAPVPVGPMILLIGIS